MGASEGRDDRQLEVLENVAWGDVENDLADTTEVIERMKKAARGGAWLWETEGEDLYGDGFSVSDEELEAMSDEMRLAYLSQLAATLASRLGMSTRDGVVQASSLLRVVGELERAA